MDYFNISTLEQLKKDLISGEWFLIGGDPITLENFCNFAYPDIKVLIKSKNPFKTIFWAKKTAKVKNMFASHDWTSCLIMIEFVDNIKSANLSMATYVRDASRIEENVNNLLSKI